MNARWQLLFLFLRCYQCSEISDDLPGSRYAPLSKEDDLLPDDVPPIDPGHRTNVLRTFVMSLASCARTGYVPFQEQVKRLEELRVTEKEELPAKLEVLEAERSCAAEELEAKKKEMANRRYMKDEELSSLGRGVLLYSRLGLEFEGGEAGQDGVTKCLRLVFRQISRNDPERPFVVAVRIDEAGQYDVPECIPVLPVEDFKRMVNDLNETNNFASFVSGVRRAFVSLAQAGL